MSESQLIRQIQDFIVEEFLFGEGSVGASEDLFATGVLDSLGFMRMLVFLDRDLGVAVSMSEIVMESFNTVDKVAAYVMAHRSD